MTKESGLGWTAFQVDDSAGTLRDIRNPTTSLQVATPRAVQDVTGLDKSAMERLLLLADMSGTITGIFDDAANSAHDVFKTVPSTSVAREFLITVSGQSLGVTGTPTIFLTDYALNRGNDGSLVSTVPFSLANGVVPTWS